MPDPPYRQVAEDLRNKIESGELAGGSRLAPEIELREQYNASRNTVRDAIKWLTARGLVETRQGRGTFVVKEIDPFVTTLTGNPVTTGESQYGCAEDNKDIAEEASGRMPISSELEASFRMPIKSELKVEIRQADDAVAGGLWLEEGAQIVSRHLQRFIDGTPWSLETTFYPMSLVQRGATRLTQPDNITEGTVAYLARECGVKQVGYRDWITVRPPQADEAWFFRLPADGRIPVLENSRTAFDEDGVPIRLTVTIFPADRNTFVVSAREDSYFEKVLQLEALLELHKAIEQRVDNGDSEAAAMLKRLGLDIASTSTRHVEELPMR